MSNKPRSRHNSGSGTDDNRRTRRKEKEAVNAEAGPSNTASSRSPDVSPRASKRTNGGNTFAEADFIAFTFSDHEEDDAPARSPPPSMREWDRGKDKGRGKGWEGRQDGEHAGRKRKAEELDLNDGYANKKQRVAAASRKAPWAKDVDWEKCANVAEMYVHTMPICRMRARVTNHHVGAAHRRVGCITRWRHSSTTCPQHP